MPKEPKKVTQYMMTQIAQLSPAELCELIDKALFTVEQRKAILKRLGDIQKDPKTTPAEMKLAESAVEAALEIKPKVDPPGPSPIPVTPKKAEPVKKEKTWDTVLWL